MTALLLFDTTHHALHAEQAAHAHGLAAEVAPAPADARAKCDLALEYLTADETRLLALLDAEQIRYHRYRPGPDPHADGRQTATSPPD